MFLTALSGYLKPTRRLPEWRDNKARSLSKAAQLARRLVEAEGLPIKNFLPQQYLTDNFDNWFAESMLREIPVYGSRAGRLERVAARGLQLTDGAQNLGPDAASPPVWRDLQVRRTDFNRYLDWLRSVW
ncbi:MAG: hypothetical protein KGJ79_01205 [Alphaproteobacteria bacterium]|nr:hypothetical protein [Alphaproteobacteria bacterium]MDE2109729.1 hypothetical protein [Alphaproteobacteria bacterium]MDE2494353.1 hypothetical protein [Alphaproteobacteria bacterium]